MIIGVFDYLVFFGLIVLNVFFWKKQIVFIKSGCLNILTFLLVLGLVIPICSIFIEFQVLKFLDKEKFENSDAFNFLYLYFKFPLYWLIIFFQIFIIGIKSWIPNKNNS